MSNSPQSTDVISLHSALFALEHSNDAVIVTDSAHRIQYANRASELVTGFEHPNLIGSLLNELLQPLAEDHRTAIPLPGERLSQLNDTFTSPTPQTVRLATGSIIPIDIKVTKIQEGYLYQFTPLSTLRELERQILLHANLLDHVKESIVAADSDCNILYWNDTAESLYGWRSSEVLGKHICDVIVPSYRREHSKRSFREWCSDGRLEQEFNHLRKDGTEFLASVSITEVKDWKNNRIGFIGLSHDLTAERAAQSELKHTISLLQATLQATEDGILVVDSKGYISAWNEQFLRMWQIPEDAIASKHDESILHIACDQLVDPSSFVTKVLDIYSHPEIESFDILTLKDGRVFERTSRPQRIDGVSAGRVWCFRDVTARHNDQHELAEQKSLYESLINAQSDMGEGFVIATPTHLRFSNDAIETITGYSREELSSIAHILDFAVPEERARLELQLERRMRGEPVPDHYETRILHKSGRVVDVEVAVKRRIVNDSVELIIIIRDITQRKEIERSLISSETKFRTVVDNLGEAIVITDIEDRIIYMNAQLEELSGYSTAECIGHTGYDLMMHESEHTKAQERLERRKAGQSESYELLLKRKNGELWWSRVNAVPYYDLDGRIIGTVAAITDIHHQKQHELELRRAEERFRFMTLATRDVVYDWVFDTNQVWWNDALAKLLKLDANESLDLEDWSVRLHPDDRERVLRGLKVTIERREQAWSDEYRIRRNDDTYAHVMDRGYVIFDDDNNPSRMIGAMMDVTDRKRAESEIMKAAANTTALIENTTDSILSLDKQLHLITFNSSFQQLFRFHNGIDPYPGLDLKNYFFGEETEFWESVFGRVMNGEHFSIERRRSVTGTPERIYEMSFNPIFENEEVVGIAIFDKDITTRKEAEEALSRSKANLSALIENTTDAIWSIDADKRLITFNTASKNLFKAMFNTLPFEGMDLSDLTERYDKKFWGENYARALSGEHYTTEHSVVIGETGYYFEVSFNPIYTDLGIGGVTVFTRDVTERKQMEHQLIAEKERAEEMSRLKSSFLANMSHEIRTPMTAILGFASIIREHSNSSDLDKYANTIERSGTRLLATINSILDLAKIEANKIDIRQQLLDPKTEIEKTADLYRQLAQSKGLEFEMHFEGNGKIVADEHYLGQVLTNLIGNALKFTQTGLIRIEMNDESNTIAINIIDTGIGISPEFLPHIFDEFKQESGGYGRNYEGSGLGLTITKRLVELMNGSLEAESELDKGSKFTLRFPKATQDVPSSIKPVNADTATQSISEASISVPRVLLVEDTHDTAEMVRIFMRGKCELEFARSAEEALQRVDKQEFDLLLMDVNLGEGRSGLDVTREIRTKQLYKQTPIIALTAFAMKGDRESALAAGCTDYLSKPFTKAQLLSKIGPFLEK